MAIAKSKIAAVGSVNKQKQIRSESQVLSWKRLMNIFKNGLCEETNSEVEFRSTGSCHSRQTPLS